MRRVLPQCDDRHRRAIVQHLQRGHSGEGNHIEPVESMGSEMAFFVGCGNGTKRRMLPSTVILVIAVATTRLVDSHAGNVFADVGSAIQ
jgi:hypothetical protein